MITAEKIENAEARCLELVNDGPTHTQYSKYFEDALKRYGAVFLREVVTDCRNGRWIVASRYDEYNSWVVDLRTKHQFGHYNGKDCDIEFSRMVFGLVLEHWLSSNAEAGPKDSAPRKFKEGDIVRIKASRSVGGSDKYKIGEHRKVSGWTVYDRKDCVIVEMKYYRPEDLELVTDEPVLVTPKVRENTGSIFADASNIPRIIIPKETAMSLKIETKTFVNGSDVKLLTVESLVSLISSTEAEIEKLKKLNSKPKKVIARIAELEEGLATLVKHADAE